MIDEKLIASAVAKTKGSLDCAWDVIFDARAMNTGARTMADWTQEKIMAELTKIASRGTNDLMEG